MLVGIVAEGPTDHIIIEGMIRHIDQDVEFLNLHPEEVLSSKTAGRNGWKGVEAWCKEHGHDLAGFMNKVSPKIDVLVIHLDCSMAHNVGGDFPCPPSGMRARHLEGTLLSWLSLPAKPSWICFALPSLMTESWLAAALPAPYRIMNNFECDDAEEELFRRRMVRKRNGEYKKNKKDFRKYVDEFLIPQMDVVVGRCDEAKIFRACIAKAISG